VLKSIQHWQDRIRDPSLTVLLVLELSAIFVAAPLTAKGLPLAEIVNNTLLFAILVTVVILSHRWGAVVLILLGLAGVAASSLVSASWSPVAAPVLHRGGDMLAFIGLSWVVGHAVYAPGRITAQRLQGAVVLYLNFALIFASVFGLIWKLNPDAFANVSAAMGEPEEVATMLYFSLTTLSTTGYGDVVAVDPFARSLATLEAIIGQFYIAITIARLVTLEVGDRSR
jgi:hypothetical protein